VGEHRRSGRALANDQIIRTAAANEIVRVGVDRLSPREIAQVAGLTHGAIYARFESVDELLIDLWNSTLRDRLTMMSQLSKSVAQDPSARTVGELFEFLRHADACDLAAIEVLLVSRRIPTLGEETESFVREHLETIEASPATHICAVMLFGLAMVQIFVNAQFGFDPEYESAFEKLLIDALGAAAPDALTRDSRADQTRVPDQNDGDRTFAGGDLRSELAHATCDVVGKSGCVGATISRIARRSNCSPAAIYLLHRSKQDLMVSALVGLMAVHSRDAVDIEEMLNAGHLAELLSREASDESKLRRNFALEMVIAAGHSDSTRSIVLAHFIECGSVEPELVERVESQYQPHRYARRAIDTVVLAVSWMSTVTNSTASFDMESFAEPLRCGLRNQWFPDELISAGQFPISSTTSHEVSHVFME
jgi:AcrR family transcriptional regulator